ncbi:MAG TPA: bifunctional phosphoglucose/phosphomannose isomerase [Candidatus Saccharimonadales bacterium]|nr:bifunctional phosphoglucose/phosphomannose isomerase [Candidatus Saccharimonadales bacterium]
MLDDLKYIHNHDLSDALGVAEKQPAQLNHNFDAVFEQKDDISNIVVGGMGGSGWPALYLKSWPGLSLPFEVVSNYELPKYVGPNTLFIASSYSGNTEETLAALAEAEKRGAQITVMSNGGKLSELAKKHSHALFVIPAASQPRMATFYFLAAYIQLFERLGLIPHNSQSILIEAGHWLSGEIKNWLATVPSSKNQAKQLAREMVAKSVVVYAGPLLAPVALKWKICINENAKHIAWWNQFPEISHNEFIGWSSQPLDKPYCTVDLRSSLDNPRVAKRFDITGRMLSGLRPDPEVVNAEGKTPLEQVLWTSVLGDFTSIYLGLLENVDPTPVELVEKFKKELNN